MESKPKTAVVTGANRGIGFEICRQLIQKGVFVILTCRDQNKGEEAMQQLQNGDGSIRFHTLDVTDASSIEKLGDFIEKEYGYCDILINNAGVFPDTSDASSNGWPSVLNTEIDTVHKAMTTNVYGPMLLCQRLVPLMKKNNYGRIVNLSSGMGQLTHMNGGCPAYRISKTSINALTRILADELKGINILVNSMCPGWVKTKMGGPGATRSVEEGADTALWLAMLDDDGPSGKFFRDRKEFEW
jgi:NAD(P)-dependent dehydrogenase (short-subunit alcohol dehydrogenase family)